LQCWEDDPVVQAALVAHNLTALEALRGFEKRVEELLRALNRTPVVWQEAQDNGVLDTGSAVVEPWKCWNGLHIRASAAAIRSNHSVVMAACWYLDWDTRWEGYLRADGLDAARSVWRMRARRRRMMDCAQGRVCGGEGAMWTEHVDVTNFECRLNLAYD
jgi:hypothetical protein